MSFVPYDNAQTIMLVKTGEEQILLMAEGLHRLLNIEIRINVPLDTK